MIKFEKEELIKLANLSGLQLNDEEIAILLNQIKLVLNYTEELEKVELSKELAPIKNVNLFREDKVFQFDSTPILKQAPKSKNTYFVVPKVLKKNIK
ncbi:Asp-tRNA(Asn)/Glu-tRNA(Gln) amidotransferase subunit GatC [Candidatus Dependentiae bacterium]|nr:Asp-tRNA(Asn)/Glu-tRNA(Gln) amidotransferase subunit GatC [Candidatus Dependentiae bacterium]